MTPCPLQTRIGTRGEHVFGCHLQRHKNPWCTRVHVSLPVSLWNPGDARVQISLPARVGTRRAHAFRCPLKPRVGIRGHRGSGFSSGFAAEPVGTRVQVSLPDLLCSPRGTSDQMSFSNSLLNPLSSRDSVSLPTSL